MWGVQREEVIRITKMAKAPRILIQSSIFNGLVSFYFLKRLFLGWGRRYLSLRHTHVCQVSKGPEVLEKSDASPFRKQTTCFGEHCKSSNLADVLI